MKRHDFDALKKCVSLFRKSSATNEMAVRCMLVEKGFHATAYHCCRLLQQRALGLPSTSLAPSELRAEKVGGLGPEIWLVDPAGIDEFRWLSASTLRSLLRLGLSRYEPSPAHAVEQEQARRKALGVAEPAGDAA